MEHRTVGGHEDHVGLAHGTSHGLEIDLRIGVDEGLTVILPELGREGLVQARLGAGDVPAGRDRAVRQAEARSRRWLQGVDGNGGVAVGGVGDVELLWHQNISKSRSSSSSSSSSKTGARGWSSAHQLGSTG